MTTPSMKSTLLAAMLLSTGCGGQEETTAQSHTKAKKAKKAKKAEAAAGSEESTEGAAAEDTPQES